MKRLGLVALALLMLTACDDRPPPESRQVSNPDKYARDRELCRAQVSEYMRNRRVAEDSSREVLAGDSERYGQGQVRNQMAAYGDTRTYDSEMARCLEARGWAQPRPSWWQRLGTPHTF